MVNIVTLMWKEIENLIEGFEDNQLHSVLDQRQNYEKFLLETNSGEDFTAFLFSLDCEMCEVLPIGVFEDLCSCFVEHLSFIHIGSGVDFKKAARDFLRENYGL